MTTAPEVFELIDPRLFADPVPDAPGEGVILASSCCPRCARHEFPRRTRCPACGELMVDARLSDWATLSGFTAVLHQPPQSLLQAPYLVGVAAFPEGLSVLGVVIGDGLDKAAIGDRVDVVSLGVGRQLGFAFSHSR